MLKPSDYTVLEAILNSTDSRALVEGSIIVKIGADEYAHPINRLNMVYALTVIDVTGPYQLVEVSRTGRDILRNKDLEAQLATGFTGAF